MFFVPKIEVGVLDPEESRHAAKVLRKNVGDFLEITDGTGALHKARFTSVDPKRCEFQLVETIEIAKPSFSTHIAIAPTKNLTRVEWFVEKATEVGIDEISFVVCQHSERRHVNLDRIRKVAISAIKQSGRAYLPRINELTGFKELISKDLSSIEQRFIAHVDPSSQELLVKKLVADKHYLVLIGPEGDFSDQEVEMALEHDFKKVSLGDYTLRTETAALAAVLTILGFNQQYL